ncbi:hypothetical protein CHLRE_14g617276v5 [Chlamydomonas reinhardtii]|uniref:Uncharacterized protein n=1 Tax=Chlamydomonas reinhardtii TaxID=3055 RepID=A0A2K3CXQ0_CHLRE|nr:uncharacterized protein CHLRE_14g617276v5 [Chlamydomonas reinhardtii]PNW73061.1 hypothetical protein CHLRE_14g617276v5 [Chlamydomonas reinhardtii]
MGRGGVSCSASVLLWLRRATQSATSSSPSCRAAPALALFAEHHDFTPWSLRDLAWVARLLAGRPRPHGFAMLLAGRSLLPGSQWRVAERLFR